MSRRGAGRAGSSDSGDDADLQRPEDHCRELIKIVDGFDPSAELRAWVLHVIDLEQIRTRHDWLARFAAGGQPIKRGRGRPLDRAALDLARAAARVWMELSGEFPPISKEGGEGDGRFVDLVLHAFGRAGRSVGRRRAYDAALRVSRELPDQHPAPLPTHDESPPEPSLDELLDAAVREITAPSEAREMDVLKKHRHRRPRRGPKPVKEMN